MQITANEMYPDNPTVVEQLLNDMATLPIRKVGELYSLKFIQTCAESVCLCEIIKSNQN